MKELVLKRVIKGLFYGCAMFVCALVFIDIRLDNSLSVLPHQYTRIVIGAMIIGVAFVMSSLIYDEDRIPFFARGLLQLLICAGALLIGFFVSGGLPDGTGFGTGAVFFIAEITFGLLIWLGNFIFFLREARMIKKKLMEKNKL